MNKLTPCYELPIGLLRTDPPVHTYHFCIGNYVLAHPDYAQYYHDKLSKREIVILDNGLHETGHPLLITDILKAIDILGWKEDLYVIAPDKLFDAQWTSRQSLDFLQYMQNRSIKIAAVIQGDNTLTMFNLYTQFQKEPFDMFCLPFKTDRPSFLRNYPLRNDRPLHLLGSYGLDEIYWLRKYICLPSLTSIDTAKPIKAGVANIPLHQYQRGLGKWKVDQPLTVQQISQIHRNIDSFNLACRGNIDHYPIPPYDYQRP